jgi:hypothetical protein
MIECKAVCIFSPLYRLGGLLPLNLRPFVRHSSSSAPSHCTILPATASITAPITALITAPPVKCKQFRTFLLSLFRQAPFFKLY